MLVKLLVGDTILEEIRNLSNSIRHFALYCSVKIQELNLSFSQYKERSIKLNTDLFLDCAEFRIHCFKMIPVVSLSVEHSLEVSQCYFS